MKKFLRIEDMFEIVEFFAEKGYPDGISIVNEVDQKTLTMINDDIRYRYSNDETNKELQGIDGSDIDCVTVNVGGYLLKYALKSENDSNT